MIEIVPVNRIPQSSYRAVPTDKEPISTALNVSPHFEYSTKNVNKIIIEMAFMMTLVEIVTVSSELVNSSNDNKNQDYFKLFPTQKYF